jgi:hypothetical protein
MEDRFQDSGKIIIWKGWGYINGLMVGNIWANIEMIKNMDMGFIYGAMEENIVGGGAKGNNMD